MPTFTGRLRTPALAAAPATPAVGEEYYDTVSNKLFHWNGTVWMPVPRVTAGAMSSGPPASPVDGDIWIALSVGANNEVWQFRYNAGGATVYKWEFIGGSPVVLAGEALGATQTTINTWQYLAGTAPSPSFTIPRNGYYIVQGSSSLSTGGAPSGTQGYVGIDVASGLSPVIDVGINATAAGMDIAGAIGPFLTAALTATQLIRLLHYTTVQPVAWGVRARSLSVQPVKIQ